MCAYVDAARLRDEPVERIIVDLKCELTEAGMIDRYSLREDRAMAESVVRWCIERFYAPADMRRPDGG